LRGASDILCKRFRGHGSYRSVSQSSIDQTDTAAKQNHELQFRLRPGDGGFQRRPACWMAKYSNFNAASSEGKLPRVVITLRKLRFKVSTAFVP
jgi:hypothetical protein